MIWLKDCQSLPPKNPKMIDTDLFEYTIKFWLKQNIYPAKNSNKIWALEWVNATEVILKLLI